MLHDADVATTRKLLREGGAADVLPAPVSEPAIASSLDRLFSQPETAAPTGEQGRVVAMLKAGGGVGATALTAQTAALLARRGAGSVCVADFDLQFGAASAYLDLPEAITVMDCLSAGAELADTPFAKALATHPSGVRLLAAPQDVTPLEALTPTAVEGILAGLRRAFALNFIDLPGDWTPWSSYALQRADEIVLVTHLSVVHMQHLKRQLRMLAQQQLERLPVTIVCNAVSSEQQSSLSIKAAERALGRSFDLVIPDESKVMTAALNQGVELSTVRRGTKVEKAIGKFADAIAARAPAFAAQKGR